MGNIDLCNGAKDKQQVLSTLQSFSKPITYCVIAGNTQQSENLYKSQYLIEQLHKVTQKEALTHLSIEAKNNLISVKQLKDFQWEKEWYQMKSGGYFKGKLDKNVPHDFGYYIFKNGSYYQGNIDQGLPQGQGLYIDKDGLIYKGQFNLGKCHNEGQMSWDKQRIKGKWIYGNLKTGIYTSSKTSYCGQFKNNKFQGIGQLKTQKYIYKGQFANGKLHGQGILEIKNKQYKVVCLQNQTIDVIKIQS